MMVCRRARGRPSSGCPTWWAEQVNGRVARESRFQEYRCVLRMGRCERRMYRGASCEEGNGHDRLSCARYGIIQILAIS